MTAHRFIIVSGLAGLTACGPHDICCGPPAVASVTVAPTAETLTVGDTGRLTATVKDAGGIVLADRAVTWTSSDPAIAMVSATGLVTGVSASALPTTITASREGVQGSAAITVNSSGGGSSFTTVVAAYTFSCALNADRQAYCWGLGGQLGAPTSETCVTQSSSYPCSTRPVAVSGGLAFAALSATWSHTCAVTPYLSSGPSAPTGTPYCWGSNFGGQLGDGTTTNRLLPTSVALEPTFGTGLPPFTAISSGYTHTCGLTMTGDAYCWGGEMGHIYGQLGDGTTAQRLVPTAVVGGLSFAAVSAGSWHTCGVTTGGAAYCWGHNLYGELGDSTTTDRLVPTPVAGGLTFVALSAGFGFTCGITTSGAAYCWGKNELGELGDGTTTGRIVPTQVASGLTFATVSAAYYHACGVTTTGTAYCWGSNASGRLGIGNDTGPEQCAIGSDAYPCSRTPVAVAGGYSFAVVAAGWTHTCGATTSGAAYCWGQNEVGQLGDGTTIQRLVPAPVAFP